MKYVLRCVDGYYRYMQDGEVVLGKASATEFEKEEAEVIHRQLPSFHPGNWQMIEVPSPVELINLFGSSKDVAKKVGCYRTTVSKWFRTGRVTAKFIPTVMNAIEEVRQ